MINITFSLHAKDRILPGPRLMLNCPRIGDSVAIDGNGYTVVDVLWLIPENSGKGPGWRSGPVHDCVEITVE